MRLRRGILLVLVLVAGIAIANKPQKLSDGVWSVEVGRCAVDYYTPPTQDQRTLVLACPGVDLIRLWPWPPMQPWFEDGGAPQNLDVQQAKVIANLA